MLSSTATGGKTDLNQWVLKSKIVVCNITSFFLPLASYTQSFTAKIGSSLLSIEVISLDNCDLLLSINKNFIEEQKSLDIS